MNNNLAIRDNSNVAETFRTYGKKALYYVGKVANHPLIKPVVLGGIAYFLGKKVMNNDYSATVDLKFAKISLTKNTTASK